jgi:hypothetical protein
MSIQYNALEYAQQLEAAGVPQPQAEVHAQILAHVLDNCVVLPSELHDVKTELSHSASEAETRLRGEIQGLRLELISKMEVMEARLLAEIDKKSRFLKWSTGLIAALLIGMYVQLLFR